MGLHQDIDNGAGQVNDLLVRRILGPVETIPEDRRHAISGDGVDVGGKKRRCSRVPVADRDRCHGDFPVRFPDRNVLLPIGVVRIWKVLAPVAPAALFSLEGCVDDYICG